MALQKEYHHSQTTFFSLQQNVQKSYLKDTTDFIDFIERTKVLENTILMQERMVTSMYTNIPRMKEQRIIDTVRKALAYETFYKKGTLIPTHSLRELLRFILQANSFQQESGLSPNTCNRNGHEKHLYVCGRDRNNQQMQ